MIPRSGLLIRRLQMWLPAGFWMFLFLYAVWPWLPWKAQKPRQVVVYGFSILGEALNESVFPAFKYEWEKSTGENLEFVSSFAGSGTVTNQLIMGVPAQLALLSTQLDVERLANSGLLQPGVPAQFPCQGVVNRSPIIILVRRGNPRHIRDFSDLARRGIRVVHPDPLTSGAANWAILAEYGAGMRQNPDKPQQSGYRLLLGIWRNVVAQAQSARTARMQFENGFGDALITYEQEPLRDKARGILRSEIVYPRSTILSEHILVSIARNIDADQQKAVNSFAGFLWSDRAQRLFVDAGFRSVDERLNTANPRFGRIDDPFLVSSLGGWDKAKKEIVDQIWRDRVLKELGRQQ